MHPVAPDSLMLEIISALRVKRHRWVAPVGFTIYLSSLRLAYSQVNNLPQNAPSSTSRVTALSSVELWLAAAVIVFGFIVLGMQFALLRRAANTQAEDVLRLFTVTTILIGTLALIAIGYSSQQIAPALGLFGTILGYLLGRTEERQRGRQHANEPLETQGRAHSGE